MRKNKKRSKLAITVCATKSYLYATRSQARRVAANVDGWPPGLVVMVGDGSPEFDSALDYWRKAMPEGWLFEAPTSAAYQESANYKESAQLTIARMRSVAFSVARKWAARLCWSLDSDVLPPPNALDCMAHMLGFDGGYYGVSTCSYPNDSYLGGRGNPQNPILPNFYHDELTLPPLVANALKILDKTKRKDPARHAARRSRLLGWIERRNYAPKGNVFEMNGAKGWRQRGWFENAYPGIGLGSVVPVDWCGFGCTLMSRKALSLAHFEGYEGKGTEDLWVCFKQWHAATVRINCIAHVVCDHVISLKKKGVKEGGFDHLRAYHEPSGDSAGHLRTERTPWLYD